MFLAGVCPEAAQGFEKWLPWGIHERENVNIARHNMLIAGTFGKRN